MSNTASQADRILSMLNAAGYGFQVYNRGDGWRVTYDGDPEGHVSRGDDLADALAQVAMYASVISAERVQLTEEGAAVLASLERARALASEVFGEDVATALLDGGAR